MANLPNHLYGVVTVTVERRGYTKRRMKELRHLVNQCPRCAEEKRRAKDSEESPASVEKY